MSVFDSLIACIAVKKLFIVSSYRHHRLTHNNNYHQIEKKTEVIFRVSTIETLTIPHKHDVSRWTKEELDNNNAMKTMIPKRFFTLSLSIHKNGRRWSTHTHSDTHAHHIECIGSTNGTKRWKGAKCRHIHKRCRWDCRTSCVWIIWFQFSDSRHSINFRHSFSFIFVALLAFVMIFFLVFFSLLLSCVEKSAGQRLRNILYRTGTCVPNQNKQSANKTEKVTRTPWSSEKRRMGKIKNKSHKKVVFRCIYDF